MKKVLISLLLAVSATSVAAPINQQHIPADAKWLFHADFEALRNSEMGTLIGQEIEKGHQKKIEGMTALLGTVLTKDLYGITLYGPDADEINAVALIHAKYNKEKLLALLGMSEKYSESSHQDQTIYHWFDEKHQRDQVGAFATEELIVISQSKAAVTKMLDTLKDPSGSIANVEGNVLAGLSETTGEPMMIAAADELSKLNENNNHAAILKNSKMMAVIICEKNGDMNLKVDGIAESDEAAIKKVVQQLEDRGMDEFL